MQTTMQKIVNGIDTEAMHELVRQVSVDPARGKAGFSVATSWTGGTRSQTRVKGWRLGGQMLPKDFTIHIDEPVQLLGQNTAPNPQEYLMAAVNACMMATYVGVCAAQGIKLNSLSIEMHGELDLRGFLGLDPDVKPGYDELEYIVRIEGDGTPEQFEQVHQQVMATSPNFWNMAQPVRMKPRLVIS